MPKQTYNLVNPKVLGSMTTSVKADNSLKAARELYKGLSEHFNNTIPAFYFTIQKGGSGKGKLYNFKVTEEKSGEEVDFTLEPFKVSNEKDAFESFQRKLNKFNAKCEQVGGKSKTSKKKRKGGKRSKDDSDSDSDFDDDDRMDMMVVGDDEWFRTFYGLYPTIYDYPISYFWYDPAVFNLDFYYIPTFYTYLTPFIEVAFLS